MKKKPSSKTKRHARSQGAAPCSPALTWTRTKPRSVGWWWYRWSRDGHRPQIVEIVEEEFGPNTDLFIRTGPGQDDTAFIENWDGEWAGPLRIPSEPPENSVLPKQ
jgi:hypothetical protein